MVDESEEEGSMPKESAEMSVEEDNAKESNSDMLLGTYWNKNKKKV